MKFKAVYMVAVLLVFAVSAMSIPAISAAAGDGKSTLSSNPIKETIDKPASIKEMQSKPAPGLKHNMDALGNDVPDQTENSGKQCLGS